MKKSTYVFVCLMTALCAVAADKKYVEVDGLTFEIDEGMQVAALQKVSGDIVDLVVPETVTADGVEYQVYGIACNEGVDEGICQNHTNLKTVNTGLINYLPESSFKGCTSLESAVLHAVETIDKDCFKDCASLVSIDTPTLFALGSGAFMGCTSLKECHFNMLADMGAATFAGCTALERVSFDSTFNIRISIMPGDGYDDEEYYPGTFMGCKSLREVTFASAIYGNGNSKRKQRGGNNMYGLSCGIFGDMFEGCESLEKLTLCKDMVYYTGVLENIKSLKSLTLGVGCISHLRADAVTGCDIREIHCMFPVPPELIMEQEPIEVDKATCVVYVPKGCRERYMQSRYWSGYANIVEDETVEPAFDPALGPKSWAYAEPENHFALYPTEHEGELAYALPYFQFSEIVGNTPIFANYISGYNAIYTEIKMPEEPVTVDGQEYRVTEVAPFTAATTICIVNPINIVEGCKRIGRYAFYGSGNRVPEWEFDTEESLALTINLPSTLESIGEHAFDGMETVRTINCMAVVPPALENDMLFGSAEARADITLNVPMESVTAYRTTPVWSDFKVVGVAGVSEARVDTADGEAEYYNLQGIRVTPDAPGIYIRRTADSVTKVLLRDL